MFPTSSARIPYFFAYEGIQISIWQFSYTVNVKLKVNLSLCLRNYYAMKIYWWSGCIKLCILNLGIGGR